MTGRNRARSESTGNLKLPYRLAGHNLIYGAWMARGRPVNRGWTLDSSDLQAAYDPKYEGTLAFLIDFDPGSTTRIGIIGIERIHLYTYGDRSTKTAIWSPAMLELVDIMYDDDYTRLKPDQKAGILETIQTKRDKETRFVEFLYLNGDKESWNWGRNGSTNAAFIQAAARDYFRRFF